VPKDTHGHQFEGLSWPLIPQGFAVGQKVRLLTSRIRIPAKPFWSGADTRPKGWELGLELLDATVDFWGLSL